MLLVVVTVVIAGLAWVGVGACARLWRLSCAGRGWLMCVLLALLYCALSAMALLFALVAIVGLWS